MSVVKDRPQTEQIQDLLTIYIYPLKMSKIYYPLNLPQSKRIFPFLPVLTPTRPNLVMAWIKALLKASGFLAHVSTVGLDLLSVQRTWSDVNKPLPCWRFWKQALSKALGVFGSMSMAILGSTFRGHIPCNWVAYCRFRVGSTGF